MTPLELFMQSIFIVMLFRVFCSALPLAFGTVEWIFNIGNVRRRT